MSNFDFRYCKRVHTLNYPDKGEKKGAMGQSNRRSEKKDLSRLEIVPGRLVAYGKSDLQHCCSRWGIGLFDAGNRTRATGGVAGGPFLPGPVGVERKV